ncbi:MAG: hypothetical protein IJ794_15970 [Lachnospiraceae bacterium]|nr:hypothetical protein [Lachnospiraceae bacterium]
MSKKGVIFDKDAQKTIATRKQMLEAELEEIRRVMSGHSNDIYEQIMGEDDRIDAGKLDRMIGQMMEALAHYKECCGEEPLTEEQEQWYRSYLYLAITGPKYIYAHCTNWIYYSDKFFADLYKLADGHMDRKDLHDLIWRERHTWSCEDDVDEDFLFTMTEALQSLTGKDIDAFYTEEERAAFKDVEPALEWSVDDRIDSMDVMEQIEQEKRWAEETAAAGDGDDTEETAEDDAKTERETAAEYTGTMEKTPVTESVVDTGNLAMEEDFEDGRMYEEEIYETPEWDTDMMETWFQMRMDEARESVERWMGRLPVENRFEEEYLHFRRNLLVVDHSHLQSDMEHLVEAYLYEQGISAYSLDDTYGLVDKALEMTKAGLYREIGRARHLMRSREVRNRMIS